MILFKRGCCNLEHGQGAQKGKEATRQKGKEAIHKGKEGMTNMQGA